MAISDDVHLGLIEELDGRIKYTRGEIEQVMFDISTAQIPAQTLKLRGFENGLRFTLNELQAQRRKLQALYDEDKDEHGNLPPDVQ